MRQCPGCGDDVNPSASFCSGCGRFVRGGPPTLVKTGFERGLVIGLWYVFWPVSMLFGTPPEVDDRISWGRLLWGVCIGLLCLAVFVALARYKGLLWWE
jgi:hypothetical protein